MSSKMICGFIAYAPSELKSFRKDMGFVMTDADFALVQKHFCEELRDPTEAELRVVDALWGERVRHGSLWTRIAKMDIHRGSNPAILKTFEKYLALFNLHHKGRAESYPSLVDLSLIASRELFLRGKLAGTESGSVLIVPSVGEKSDNRMVVAQVVPPQCAVDRVFEYQSVCVSFDSVFKGKPVCTQAACSLGAMTQKAWKTQACEAGDVAVLVRGESDVLRDLLLRAEVLKVMRRRCFVGTGGLAAAAMVLANGMDMTLDAAEDGNTDATVSGLALHAAVGGVLVAVAKKAVKKLLGLASGAGLQAVEVGQVTDKGRLRLYHGGNLIVDLPHAFLTAGGVQHSAFAVLKEKQTDYFKRQDRALQATCKKGGIAAAMAELMARVESSSAMSSRETLPQMGVKGEVATALACGFDPMLTEESPFLGGIYAVVEACARAVCAGASLASMQLALQGFFSLPLLDKELYGRAVSNLLGVFSAQLGLSVGAIGLREDMDSERVPQRTVAFAFGVSKSGAAIRDRFSSVGQKLYRYRLPKDENGIPVYDEVQNFLNLLGGEALRGLVGFATVCGSQGVAAAIAEGLTGTEFSFRFAVDGAELFVPANGDVLFSTDVCDDYLGYELQYIGEVTQG